VSTQYNGQAGNITLSGETAITSSTDASPIAVTCVAPHNLATNDTVDITGHLVNTNANGEHEITVTGANTFTLNGSTGTGAGAGSGGAAYKLTLGQTTAIPSDGDATAAASVDTPFETALDRTAWLATRTGRYKLNYLFETALDDGSTETDPWDSTYTFTAKNTWLPVTLLPGSPTAGTLQAGDVIDCEFRFSFSWSDTSTSNEGFMLALGAAFAQSGDVPGSAVKILGSAMQVPGPDSNGGRTSVALRGRITVPVQTPAVQTIALSLMAFTIVSTFADVSFSTFGDYQLVGAIWRPTGMPLTI
jgi:hypothetical protein